MTGTCASDDNRCYTIYERNYSSISNGPCPCSTCLYPMLWLYYPWRAWVTYWLKPRNMDGSTLACRVLKTFRSCIISLWVFFWEPETFQMHLIAQTEVCEILCGWLPHLMRICHLPGPPKRMAGSRGYKIVSCSCLCHCHHSWISGHTWPTKN